MIPPRVAAAVLLFAVGTARAQAPAGSEVALTVDEIAQRAAAADERAGALGAEVASARAAVGSETLWRNPELRSQFSHNRRTDMTGSLQGLDESFDEYDVAARFFVPRPWEAAAEARRRRAGVDVAETRVAAAAGEAAAEARRLCDDIAYEEAMLGILARRRALREEAARWIREHGLLPDVAAADLDLLNAARARDEAARRLDDSQRALAGLIGLRESAGVRIIPDKRPAWFLDAADADLLRLATRIPDPASDAADASAREAQARAAAARADRWPWLEFIQGGYGEDSRDDDGGVWTVYAGFSLPVFSWVWDAGRADAAAAAVHRLRADTAADRRAVAVARALESARAAWQAYDAQSAERTALVARLRETLAADVAGAELTPLQRLRMEEALIEAERGDLEARRARDAAVTALRIALSPDRPLEPLPAAP